MNKFAGLFVVGLLLAGCTTAPVLNLRDTRVPVMSSGAAPTVETVEKAIITAAHQRGWSAQIVKPGLIEASIIVRTHRAKIEITYSGTHYSINYVDSYNLSYDGRNIHKNYNNWIVRLSQSIQKEIIARY
jgi:hypothetical protein